MFVCACVCAVMCLRACVCVCVCVVYAPLAAIDWKAAVRVILRLDLFSIRMAWWAARMPARMGLPLTSITGMWLGSSSMRSNHCTHTHTHTHTHTTHKVQKAYWRTSKGARAHTHTWGRTTQAHKNECQQTCVSSAVIAHVQHTVCDHALTSSACAMVLAVGSSAGMSTVLPPSPCTYTRTHTHTQMVPTRT